MLSAAGFAMPLACEPCCSLADGSRGQAHGGAQKLDYLPWLYMRRGQGEALIVDRHELYQALYYALGASPLGALQAQGNPTAEGVSACTASSPQHAATAAGRAGKGGAGRAKQKGGSSRQDSEGEAEQLPLEVLLARVAHQMLVDQVPLTPLPFPFQMC